MSSNVLRTTWAKSGGVVGDSQSTQALALLTGVKVDPVFNGPVPTEFL